MDGSETVAIDQIIEADTPTPPWRKAFAYSAIEDRLKTPEDREWYLASLEESLLTAAGIDQDSADRPDISGLLRLFFLGETFVFTDETGTEYVWNVTRAKEIMATVPHEVIAFCPGEYGITADEIRARYPGFEMEHTVGADLTKPVIFLPFKGEHLLIDGWHRLYRAVSDNVETLPCHILTEAEAHEILASRSIKGGIDE